MAVAITGTLMVSVSGDCTSELETGSVGNGCAALVIKIVGIGCAISTLGLVLWKWFNSDSLELSIALLGQDDAG